MPTTLGHVMHVLVASAAQQIELTASGKRWGGVGGGWQGIDGVSDYGYTPSRQFFLYNVRMGKRTESWMRLTSLVEAYGEDEFLDEVCSRIAIGEHPLEIARSKGLSWKVLRTWLEGEGRIGEYESARRAFADKLSWDALREVMDADIETVGVAKLRADTFTKHAGFHDRGVYGNRTEIDVKETHVVDIRGLMELREARVRELSSQVIDVVPSVVFEEVEI